MKTNPLLFTILFIVTQTVGLLAQKNTIDTTQAKQYFEKADEYYKNKSYDTAIVYFEKASTLFEKQRQWKKYLQSETKRGDSYSWLWKLDKGAETINSAIKKTLLHTDEKDTVVANAYHILGISYYFLSKLDSALFYWKKAFVLRKDLLGEKHVDVASSCNNVGSIYDIKNEYDLSLQYYYKALKIRKEIFGEEHPLVAESYNNIGIVFYGKNEYDLAFKYYFKALQIRKKVLGEKHENIAVSYNNIGAVYKNKSEYDLALQYHIKAMQIFKDNFGEEHSFVAEAYNNIGIDYSDKRDYDSALKYMFKALELRKKLLGEDNLYVAMSYNGLGNVYEAKNEYDLALEYHFKGLKIKKERLGENHPDVAISYNNIGIVLEKKGEYDSALEYYQKSLTIKVKMLGEKHSLVAASYVNVGNIYMKKNKYDSALKYYQKGVTSSLRNFNDTTNVYSVPDIENYLNWEELSVALKSKAVIFADTSKHLLNSGNIQGIKRQKLALRHYQACDTLISQVRKNMKAKSDKIALGEQASEIYKGAVIVCLNLLNIVGADSVSYYRDRAFYFSEKNKSSVLLESLAGAEALKFAGIPDTLLKLEHKLQVDIALYKKILAEGGDSIRISRFQNKLFKANRTYDSLIIVIENDYPEYFDLKYNRESVSIKQIQKLLNRRTAIISYFTGDNIITVMAVTHNKNIVLQVPKPENLDSKIKNLRTGISDISLIKEDIKNNTDKTVKLYDKLAFELYSLLFPEEIKEILSRKIKNIILIPDGQLATLPFEALHTKKYITDWNGWEDFTYFSNMPYLVKDYNISYSYSANLFYKTFDKHIKKNKVEIRNLSDWLAFAPVFDDENISGTAMRTRNLLEKIIHTDTIKTRTFTRDGMYISELPGSLEETETIFKLYESRNKEALLKTHLQANEEFVKSGELAKYKYLHFATHGMVDEDKPELSGLILAQDTTSNEDNILFSGEIYNIKLNADLIVLSACETGLGKISKGEGIIGLTRALLYAGSKNIIVSLWQVSDASTQELMVEFYKNMLKPSVFSKNQKYFAGDLQKAKLRLIEESKYAHPFFWSPFILIGK
ncbi:MAG: CHAT domain-containing protein [Bacteroidales bacterium]|nr:CHAT domain-containing protein [Bacteroidales bacterium]